jgi:hypothetical protein
VVALKAACRWFGYILPVCGNGQWWAHRHVAQIPRFAKSHWVCNYTQSVWDRHTSPSSTPCSNNWEVICLIEQHQAFAPVVWLGQNRVPHTWLLNTEPSGVDNRASDLDPLSGVGQMRVLHDLMSNLNITMSM